MWWGVLVPLLAVVLSPELQRSHVVALPLRGEQNLGLVFLQDPPEDDTGGGDEGSGETMSAEEKERIAREKDQEKREKLFGINWSAEGAPNPDDWAQQHQNDLAHHEIDDSTLTVKEIFDPNQVSDEDEDPPWSYKGNSRRLPTEIIPDGPILHPGVQPNTPHPSDFAKTGADFEVEPPEPMAPQPPYLYPPQSASEFNYNVPPTYHAFYPASVPVATPAESNFPSQTMQPLVASPQFDLPMPFAHGPMFPAFHPPGPGEPSINPPPMVPLPAPANYNGNARRTPAMPMPPLPPAMWPYG